MGRLQPVRGSTGRLVRLDSGRLLRSGEAAGDGRRGLEQRFGLVVAEGYGLTEASPVVTSSTGLTPRRGSVGAVLDGIELRIVDEAGDDVIVGDAGELWVRGPNVFAGYLDDAEATARVLTADGWLRTGDIGYCDDDGFVYLVDRAKDLIIVSGFNVFPPRSKRSCSATPGSPRQVSSASLTRTPAKRSKPSSCWRPMPTSTRTR